MARPKGATNDPGRRERIALAAVELIHERGVGSVSARAVADRCAVPVASVSYYFDSVSALLIEACRLVLQERSRELDRWLAASTPETVITDLAALVVRQLTEQRATSMIAYELYVLGMRDDGLREVSAASVNHLRHRLKGLVPPSEVDRVAATADGYQMHCLFEDRVPTAREVAVILQAA
ncbi:TetR/AcrR family transcriptional regulator [Streptomyces sp. HB132]|uniref:TetR/AcrR family transcriptional regulator n=1 Tax=Streptomyces sp. HB132 TaxID=767388 RepID=UPI00196224FD|nr:TetR family transcriptional regulator [Streptomyces sp. HB132]MBM7439355.1 DNA-binding transcriptional regulator YbjK [Streptomyces sp. HB132]